MPETFAYSVAQEQALATIRAIFAGPVNFIDTAASYGDGESERRLGIVLRELGELPPGFVLASKADRNLQTGEFSIASSFSHKVLFFQKSPEKLHAQWRQKPFHPSRGLPRLVFEAA